MDPRLTALLRDYLKALDQFQMFKVYAIRTQLREWVKYQATSGGDGAGSAGEPLESSISA